MTTEALPRPTSAVGVVDHDPVGRVLVVRLSEVEGGYSRLLWREGWTALRQASEAGWPADGAAWVWANLPGARQVVHSQPADGLALSFHFPPGTPGYSQLISRPGLTAIIIMDASSRRMLSVTFRSGPGGGDRLGA